MPDKRQLTSSLLSQSPIKKKPANFLKLLENRATDAKFGKNTLMNHYYNYRFNDSKLYKIKNQYDLHNILMYKPDIELHKFSIANRKIAITKYNELDYNPIIQYAQTDSPQPDQFYVSGVNIDDNIEEDFLLTRESLKYLHCDEDFSTIYLLCSKYDKYDEKEEEKIFKEFVKNQKITCINDTKKLFKDLKTKLKQRKYQSYSSASSSESSESSQNSSGGSKSLDKQKYMKKLRNYTLEKLQNIARNKKVGYTKKADGKVVSIKKETIIKKLCAYKYG